MTIYAGLLVLQKIDLKIQKMTDQRPLGFPPDLLVDNNSVIIPE